MYEIIISMIFEIAIVFKNINTQNYYYSINSNDIFENKNNDLFVSNEMKINPMNTMKMNQYCSLHSFK